MSGERPSIIRLASGRLFFTGDFNPKHEKHLHKDGAYVALSDDDGAHWTIKRLPADVLTVGYTTSTQDASGIIHIVTSKNERNYEIELNEAWVLDKNAGAADTADAKVGLTGIEKQVIKDKAGKLRAVWTTARVADGRVLLHGPEAFYYPNGKAMYSAIFEAGHKVREKYLREDGTPYWTKTYAGDGTWTWLNFDTSGKQTARSEWRGKTLVSSDVPDPPARKGEKPIAPDAE
jgi:hypothetical protein